MIHTVKTAVRWLRTPLESGAPWTAWVVAGWTLGVPALLLLLPIDAGVALGLCLFVIAVFPILLGLLRPSFFWDSGILEGWRWAFGDRAVVIIYVGIGSAFFVALLFSIAEHMSAG